MHSNIPVAASWRRFSDPLILAVVLAVLWEHSVNWFQVKAYLLPPLTKVFESLWGNRAILLSESWVTIQEVLAGFVLAVVGGVMLGGLIYSVPVINRTLYPLTVVFQGLPKIALAPLMVILVCAGHSKVMPSGALRITGWEKPMLIVSTLFSTAAR